MWYPPPPPDHGHVPSDAELAAKGFRAFAPLRQAFEPSNDDFKRAAQDVLPDDGADEFGDVARALVAERDDEFQWGMAAWYAMMAGGFCGAFDDED